VIRRTFDATFLNSVVNHPEVRPWLAGEGEIDLTPVLKNPDNFALVTNEGGFILTQHEPGIYEAHSQFMPGARTGTFRAMREVFDYMFTRTDCMKIVTQIPDNNKGAIGLGRLGKFRPMFRREDGPMGPTTYVGLALEDWVQDTPELEKDGAWFHDGIEAAKRAANSTLPDHPHDPAHERAVGATVRMVKAGSVVKGTETYNRWARFAGYPLITLASEHPVVFDMGEAVVTYSHGEMEVELCR
jgi:hypothetical protein